MEEGPINLTKFSVRFLRDGRGCGTGFLVDRRHIVTCAHVVNVALDLPALSSSKPDRSLCVEIPACAEANLEARVVEWVAPVEPGTNRAGQSADIAVLRLERPRSKETDVARFNVVDRTWKYLKFSVLGFPERGSQIANSITEGQLDNELIQVKPEGLLGGQIRGGYSGAAAIGDEDGFIIGMVVAADTEANKIGFLVPDYQLEAAWLRAANPYKGLARFEKDDAIAFFGREEVARELEWQVVRQSITVILGPTGGGKSSLVFAGLLPRLMPADWFITSFRPGKNPLASFAVALRQMIEVSDGLEKVGVDPVKIDSLPSCILPIAGGLAAKWPWKQFLIIADQLEEIFTLCDDPDERKRFIEVLAAIAGQRTIVLVATLRADFSSNVLESGSLSAILHDKCYLLRAMNPDELGRAIREPAEQLGVRFDRSVYDMLLAAAAKDNNSLPLMEFALDRLWATQTNRQIQAASYRKMKGLEGALALHADDIIAALDDNGKLLAKQLLCRLVNVAAQGPEADSKRPQARQELGRKLWAMAERLAGHGGHQARLVVIGQDAQGRDVAEIVHEALIRNWPLLGEWIGFSREQLRAREAVLQRMQVWRENSQRNDLLLPKGYDLERGRALLSDPNGVPISDIKAYIQRSIHWEAEALRREEQERREYALIRSEDIERASRQQTRVDLEAARLCQAVRSELGFDYASVQMIDKGERTISTINGSGLTSDWFAIGNHPIEGEDSGLLDIQADIATSWPLKIEIISGFDPRFDEFIYRKFGHSEHVRVFAPILLADNENQPCLEWALADDNPLVVSPRPEDKRHEYRAVTPDPMTGERTYRVIGTIEAGLVDYRIGIDFEKAHALLSIAGRHAVDLHRSSLDYVFETVVRSASEVTKADASYLGFSRNEISNCFDYEAYHGLRALLSIGGLYGHSREKPETAIYIPKEVAEPSPATYETSYPLAYKAGVRAEAAIPITLSSELEPGAPAQRYGVLRLLFREKRVFSSFDVAYLESLVNRAVQAIRVATEIGRSRLIARRLRNLHHIASLLAEDPDADNLLDEVAGFAMNMFAAEIVTVFEYEQARNVFLPGSGLAGRLKEPALAVRSSPEPGSAPFLLLAKGESEYESGVDVNSIFYSKAPRLVANFVDREAVRSSAGIILKTRSSVVGVMFLNYRSQHEFDVEQRDIAETLAYTAAIAIRNRRLIAAVR